MLGQVTGFAVGDWRQSSSYAQLLEHIQRAEWEAALAGLAELLAQYPDDAELEALRADTELRQQMEQVTRVQGKRRALLNRRTTFVLILSAVLVALAFAMANFYRRVIEPSTARSQLAAEEKLLAQQAQQAYAAGDYDQALALDDQLAAKDPQYPGLADQRAQANQAKTLQTDYDLARQQLGAGNLSGAQATLLTIQQAAANYQDVGALLADIERKQRLAGVMRQAASAVATQDWTSVVARLEEARSLVAPADLASLQADLFDAYMNLAGEMVAKSQGRPADMQRALDTYGKALALRPEDPSATTMRSYAQEFADGSDAFRGGDWDTAVRNLQELYDAQPNYLNGVLAGLLYNSYMQAAEQIQATQPTAGSVLAWDLYRRASLLKGVDTRAAAAMTAQLAPSITPVAQPAQPASATPGGAALGAQLAPLSTATPLPTEGRIGYYQGKITFLRRQQGTSGVWIMDADGQNAFAVADQTQALIDYQALESGEIRSPDGAQSLSATAPANAIYPQVFTVSNGQPTTQLTNLDGVSKAPAWSPAGGWIAFVSNQPGIDQIFRVGTDGHNLTQLTFDTSGLDEHPSWSPDGSRLVFSTTRGGPSQLWAMNADGSGQADLSNSQTDDSDPIWIK